MTSVTAATIRRWLTETAQRVSRQAAQLTALDAAIGDGDHGHNLERGFTAVVDKLASQPAADVGALLKTTGSTLISTVGGAAGPLYGTAFLRAGTALAGQASPGVADLARAMRAALDGLMARGKATSGEKTMIDAWLPATVALEAAAERGDDLVTALQGAAHAAEQGALATIPLIATKGRASYLGERSVGHQDPGATSTALLWRALADVISEAP